VSRKDICHPTVVQALQEDGWVITHDPFPLTFGGRNLYTDLGAEQPIGAEKGERRIAVEIKSFVSQSDVHDLEVALGQFILYRDILSRVDPDRALYLAVPARAYHGIFVEELGQLVIQRDRLQLIVFSETPPRIVRWIP
jgi:hypothetical protein